MKALLKGIYDEYNGDATLKAALTGGLRSSRVAPGTSTPYAVVDVVGGGPEVPFDSKYLERYRIQISIFGETAEAVADAADKAKALYDEAVLTITGHTGVGMNRLNEIFLWVDGYYQWTGDYEVMAHKT